VHVSVGSLAVVGREHIEEVIANRLVGGLVFGEAAQATRIDHLVAFQFLD
jgi:hypothetical protein